MRLLWTLVKVALGLVFVVPVAIILLAITLGILGTVLGLAIMTLRIAVFGLICWGLFALAMRLFRGSPRTPEVKSLPPVDPYYEAAKRELDRELGHTR